MRIHRWINATVFGVAVVMIGVPAYAQVNVRDFGAKGDGGTDDTKAIQKAFDHASEKRRPVLFPAGQYWITDTISIGANEIIGHGYPEIIQRDAEDDILYGTIWRTTIRGLAFRGGRDQISLGNPNTDQSFFVIRDCRFKKANGVAVRFRDGTTSAFTLIEACTFAHCMQAVITVSDQNHIRNCWITSSAEMRNKAVIENNNTLFLENILGVPLVNGADQRWIDNHGSVSCRNVRFGGEGGGFTPVVNFTRVSKQVMGPRVILDDCDVSALGNGQRMCAVYCERIPNQIIVRDCRLPGIPPVLISPKLDVAEYFRGVRKGMLSFVFEGNIGELADQVPEALAEAAAAADREPSYGDEQLSEAETQKAMATAMEAAKRLPSPPIDKPFLGHHQQTEPDRFIEITPQSHAWDLTDHMDATTQPNAEYLAVAAVQDDVVVMRRIPLRNNWPHVRIRNVKINLDQYPYLTWRLKDTGIAASSYAVKVVHLASGKTLRLFEQPWPPYFDYHAYNLREMFSLSGEQVFDIKFYCIGANHKAKRDEALMRAGDHHVIDFLRLETE